MWGRGVSPADTQVVGAVAEASVRNILEGEPLSRPTGPLEVGLETKKSEVGWEFGVR